MFAEKLKPGDEIRIVAPSRSLSYVLPDILEKAVAFLTEQGYRITFSRNCRETGPGDTADSAFRVQDLHEAFLDPRVKAVLPCIGGFHVNAILEELDYELIRANPKILCGFSDITSLLNAVYAKTGLVTYHGPLLCSFGFEESREETAAMFSDCLCGTGGFTLTPSPAAGSYRVIQEGSCAGTLIGGNLCTFNLLQGTAFLPDLRGKILFLEDDNIMGDYFAAEFERNLQSLFQVVGAQEIRGLILGRFEQSCAMDQETIARIVSHIKGLHGLPVVSGADFGHILPLSTLPIGGEAKMQALDGNVHIQITTH